MTSLNKRYQSKKLTLKNRWVMAPMTRSCSPAGIPTKSVSDYYVKRALGGVGLIITEGVSIDHVSSPGYPDVPVLNASSVEAWKSLVIDVHAAGAKIMPQLWHVGSARKPDYDLDNTIPCLGPSAIEHPCMTQSKRALLPKEMTESDLTDVKAAFVRSAQLAKHIGFDGIEIHGAHGYLLDQFLWPATNQRIDEYGGSFKNRIRFPYEVVQAIRQEVGEDFPIIYRFSQWKLGAYDYKLCATGEDLETFLQPLLDAGVDILHASSRRFWEPEFEGSDLNLAGWTKKITGAPVITVGSIGLDDDFINSFKGKGCGARSIEDLEIKFSYNEFDLAAIGRALIADAEWVNKIENNSDDIKTFEFKDLAEL